MQIPLYNRLKRQLHRDIASLQDQILEITYSLDKNAVLHGGTAIWRCFQGNRFSEDLDFYLSPKNNFKELLTKETGSLGLVLDKCKETKSTIYAKVSSGSVTVRLECALRKFKTPIVKEYERVDGSYLDVFVLSPEDLLIEKLTAFKNRKLIRDIYDVYHLSKYVELKGEFMKNVAKLLSTLPKPSDEKNLKTIILAGAIPSYGQMVETLKRRFSQ